MEIKKYYAEGKKLYSILNFKCPHCHVGNFFKSNNPYNFKSMAEAYEICPNCKRRLLIEPGFYYGAMYVSYALGVAHIVTFIVVKAIMGFEMEFWNFIILVGGFLLLLSPLYYALSKIIWANLFINYKPETKHGTH